MRFLVPGKHIKKIWPRGLKCRRSWRLRWLPWHSSNCIRRNNSIKNSPESTPRRENCNSLLGICWLIVLLSASPLLSLSVGCFSNFMTFLFAMVSGAHEKCQHTYAFSSALLDGGFSAKQKHFCFIFLILGACAFMNHLLSFYISNNWRNCFGSFSED